MNKNTIEMDQYYWKMQPPRTFDVGSRRHFTFQLNRFKLIVTTQTCFRKILQRNFGLTCNVPYAGNPGVTGSPAPPSLTVAYGTVRSHTDK